MPWIVDTDLESALDKIGILIYFMTVDHRTLNVQLHTNRSIYYAYYWGLYGIYIWNLNWLKIYLLLLWRLSDDFIDTVQGSKRHGCPHTQPHTFVMTFVLTRHNVQINKCTHISNSFYKLNIWLSFKLIE